VRIEGATQGSGVLVKREGNRYTVLTAWHVLSGQKPGEELDIYMPDGKRHQMEQNSLKRLGQVDMAVLTFTSPNPYELARIGDEKSVSSGVNVLVAGFPIGKEGRIKHESGKLVANAAVGIDQGYQLLYSNKTEAGMSGGVVMTSDGSLIGMHGRGELDERKSQQLGRSIKTGTNQGVPISYYSLFLAGQPIVASSTRATTPDDFLALAKSLLGNKGSEQEVIRLSNKVLYFSKITDASMEAYIYKGLSNGALGYKKEAIADHSESIILQPYLATSYYNRGSLKMDLGDNQGAILDFNKAINLYKEQGFRDASVYYNRGIVKSGMGDERGAIADYSQAIIYEPSNANAYNNRAGSKYILGDKQGAISDYNNAIAINSQSALAYNNRALLKGELGDKQGAITDYTKAILINPQYANAYHNRGDNKLDLGDKQGACHDYKRAASLGKKLIIEYLQGPDGAWCRKSR